MKPRQSLRLNRKQEAAYKRIHTILSNPPQKSRLARLWAILVGA